MAVMYRVQQDRAREAFEIAEADRQARGKGPWFAEGPPLPALDQVTGWRKQRSRTDD
ncbi:hypothetical protein U1701_11255 [Sphingomonas sp. PB2P19]|uniref:hypothetical protein n=1 Tax=Sphingomonas rhamnosi TaxID=3096156 RepID=UPI002FCC5D5E